MKVYVSFGADKRSRFAESREQVEERLGTFANVEIVKNARDANVIVIPDTGRPGKLHVPYETLSVFLANRNLPSVGSTPKTQGPDYARIEQDLRAAHGEVEGSGETESPKPKTSEMPKWIEPKAAIVSITEFEAAWNVLASNFDALIALTSNLTLSYISDFIVYVLTIIHTLEANCQLVLVYYSERLVLPKHFALQDVLHFTSVSDSLESWRVSLNDDVLANIDTLRARQASLAWLEAWFRNMYSEWARAFRNDYSASVSTSALNLLPKLTDTVKAFCQDGTPPEDFVYDNLSDIYRAWFAAQEPPPKTDGVCNAIVLMTRTIQMRLARTMGRVVVWKYAQPLPTTISAKLFGGTPNERNEALEWLKNFDPRYDETFLQLLVWLKHVLDVLK